MIRPLLLTLALALPCFAHAQTKSETIEDIVSNQILPELQQFQKQALGLADLKDQLCHPTAPQVQSQFHDAMDAWLSVSVFRFGPMNTNDRGFALGFWPDTRGATPKALRRLIQEEDAIAQNSDTYGEVSVAARGFYALERLIYDPEMIALGTDAYRCQLIQTIAADISRMSTGLLGDWQTGFADVMTTPSSSGIYQSDDDALRQLFNALTTGLQFDSETRLGRPLGTFDRPRPKRAEMWRANRSVQNVSHSLHALEALSLRLAHSDPVLTTKLSKAFADTFGRLSALNDPTFSGVSTPQTRLKIEVIQQSIDIIRSIVSQDLGPTLGVAAGFNSLDGD
ncbi:MAG: imelysin family protein [Aliishimia sp.]